MSISQLGLKYLLFINEIFTNNITIELRYFRGTLDI